MARDVKLLIEFLGQKHEQRNPEDTKAKELNEYLFKFILSVKRKDGKDFEPLALRGLYSSFNRHLKECKYPISVINDVAFERKRSSRSTKRWWDQHSLRKKPPGNFKWRSINKHTLALQFTAFWSMRMWTALANVVGRRSAHERCRWNWIFTFFW